MPAATEALDRSRRSMRSRRVGSAAVAARVYSATSVVARSALVCDCGFVGEDALDYAACVRGSAWYGDIAGMAAMAAIGAESRRPVGRQAQSEGCRPMANGDIAGASQVIASFPGLCRDERAPRR